MKKKPARLIALERRGNQFVYIPRPFQAYIVTAERTTEYRVLARNPEDAIDRLCMSGEGEELDQTTHKITAEPERTR
jgi:hypothetical protein